MIVLIDNYDSFTWNLWHFLSDLGAEVTTIRNDAMTAEQVMSLNPSGIVLSPGAGRAFTGRDNRRCHKAGRWQTAFAWRMSGASGYLHGLWRYDYPF